MQPSRRWLSTKGSIMPVESACSRIHLSERIAMACRYPPAPASVYPFLRVMPALYGSIERPQGVFELQARETT